MLFKVIPVLLGRLHLAPHYVTNLDYGLRPVMSHNAPLTLSRMRDTQRLNGRFPDLAVLLPNLSQIRHPFKRANVNFSIAHIHASRELRPMKLEADVLRRELNEWRRGTHPQ